MDERTEFLRSPADISGHPALKAWSQLQAEPVETGEISVLKQRLKSTIYRIKILEPRPFSIVAKYCQRRVAAHERFIYEQILPKVPVSSPYYHGFVKGRDDYDWLFLEYVEGERYSWRCEGLAALAGRWLGLLHAFTNRIAAEARLPELGSAYYLALLRGAREKLRRNLELLDLPPEDLAVIQAVISQCDFLESHWNQVEGWCESMPRTLLHGDFKPKNIIVRASCEGPVLVPFDWEASGWGVPAEDIAYVNLAAYHAVVKGHWPDLSMQDLEYMKTVGTILRGLSEIFWESVKFEPHWEVSSAKLCFYQTRMAEAIEMAKWGE